MVWMRTLLAFWVTSNCIESTDSTSESLNYPYYQWYSSLTMALAGCYIGRKHIWDAMDTNTYGCSIIGYMQFSYCIKSHWNQIKRR